MNPALSLVTMAMMRKFNRDSAWIWNTYQCYLKVSCHLIGKSSLYSAFNSQKYAKLPLSVNVCALFMWYSIQDWDSDTVSPKSCYCRWMNELCFSASHQESRDHVFDAIRLSVDQSFCLGVKLVRGAYMDKERKLALKEGRDDPIHQSWEHTNNR